MARKWPAFITADLGDTDADSREMDRRWAVYRDEMKELIAAGGVHQDADGWWVDDATGELIGPDPDIERPLSMAEAEKAKPFAEMFPRQAAAIRRGRGAQRAPTKASTTIRLSREVVDYFRAGGPGWQSRIDDALKEWMASH